MKNRTRKKQLQARRTGSPIRLKLTAEDRAWLDAAPVGREFGSAEWESFPDRDASHADPATQIEQR